MKKRVVVKLFIIGIVFLTTSCSSVRFHYERDRTADFRQYQTYAFADDLPDKAFGSNIAARELREQLRSALSVRGLTYNEENPDLLIDFSTNTETEEQSYTNYYPSWPMWGWGGFGWGGFGYPWWGRGGWWGDPWLWGPGWGWGGPMYSRSSLVKTKIGILTVEFWDADEDKMVWRGTSRGSVDTPEEMYKTISASLKKLFEKFPLKSGPA